MDKFTFIDRGKSKDIVLLRGWATDNRIFDLLDIQYNYILPNEFDPRTFEQDFLDHMSKNEDKRISILGWSMGGFTAADFAIKYQELIDDVILISVKEKYNKADIEKIKYRVMDSKKAYLYSFYLDCFSEGEERKLKWFRKNLMKEYLEKFDTSTLISGLDYLAEADLNVKALNEVKPEVIFGMKDKIVPVSEIIDLKQKLPSAKFNLIEDMGHMPF